MKAASQHFFSVPIPVADRKAKTIWLFAKDWGWTMQSIAPQELHNTIRDYVATLKRQSVAGILSTYLIFDPTETDPLEASSFGVPFYVGQGDIVHRAKDHLCGRSGVLTRRRIQTIYERGQHPRFLVVAHTRSRLTSLKSEMDWVCHLHGLGYALTNGWREHKRATPLQATPAKRVWQFSVKDALLDAVKVKVQCKVCGCRQPVCLEDLPDIDVRHTHLNQVRRTFRCPRCSSHRCLRIEVPRVQGPSAPDLRQVLAANFQGMQALNSPEPRDQHQRRRSPMSRRGDAVTTCLVESPAAAGSASR